MGFGSDPAAGSGAGVGVLVVSPALAAKGYQRSTTGAVSSIKIDGLLRDTTIDSFGNEDGMSDAAQCVQIAFGTKAGDIMVDHEAGVRWPSKLGDNITNEMRAEAARVMLPLTTANIAEFVSVEIETVGTTLYGVVKWRDMRTDLERTTRIPIG